MKQKHLLLLIPLLIVGIVVFYYRKKLKVFSYLASPPLDLTTDSYPDEIFVKIDLNWNGPNVANSHKVKVSVGSQDLFYAQMVKCQANPPTGPWLDQVANNRNIADFIKALGIPLTNPSYNSNVTVSGALKKNPDNTYSGVLKNLPSGDLQVKNMPLQIKQVKVFSLQFGNRQCISQAGVSCIQN